MSIKAPMVWFGGKSRVASLVWERFGDVPSYAEPFFGSGAVLLGRPHPPKVETVNDIDGLLCNAWRAIAGDPERVISECMAHIHECDLHAKHAALVAVRERLTRRLEGDPEYYDAKLAGWWLWGIALWIGGGWCKGGNGPWSVEDGELLRLGRRPGGIKRQLPYLGSSGQGINRESTAEDLAAYMYALSERMARVRVTCGQWDRILGPTPTTQQGITGVFLDPPYTSEAGRDMDVYATDCGSVGHDASAWAKANGNNPKLRIALCGYEGEHDMPSDWDCVPWKAVGGYGSASDKTGRDNSTRERIWFSPNCLSGRSLFDGF